MKIFGENRQEVYKTFENVYYDVTGTVFKWRSGEKTPVIQMCNRFAEELGYRDTEKFDEVLSVFKSYLEDTMEDWFHWKQSSRDNLMGFIDKKENIELYVNAEKYKDTKDTGDEIAGTDDEDGWDW